MVYDHLRAEKGRGRLRSEGMTFLEQSNVRKCRYLKGYEYCPTTILVLSDIHDSLLVLQTKWPKGQMELFNTPRRVTPFSVSAQVSGQPLETACVATGNAVYG